MRNLFLHRLRERALDAMDWVDIRPDPHWINLAIVPAILALSLFFIPEGFLPLFITLCLCAAAASLFLVVVGIAGTVLWRALRDVVRAQLAAARAAVRESMATSRGAKRHA